MKMRIAKGILQKRRRRKVKHQRGCQCNTCDRRRTRRGVNEAMSAYILPRDAHVCQFHWKLKEKGLQQPCLCGGLLSCCHKIPKVKSNALRYDERNMFAGCSGSNKWADEHDAEWERLVPLLWPEDIEYLGLRRRVITHRKRADIKAIELYYKQKMKELFA